MDDPDRRALLRGLAGGVVAGATTGIAGCADRSFLDPGGGSTDGTYLFEPGTVADGDHYTVRFVAPDVVSAYDGFLPEETVSDLENNAAWLYEATGFDFEDATGQLTFRTVAVVELAHDTAALEDKLEDDEFEEDTEEQGYRIFRSEYGDLAVAFDGATLIGARPTAEESDPEEVVEEVIETEAGEGERYDEANEPFAAVADRLDGDVFLARSHDETDDTQVEGGLFENEVARGLTGSIGEDATDVRIVLAFEEAEDVVLDDVAAWTGTEAFDDWDGVSVDGAGAVVTVSATVDTGAFELSVPRAARTASPLHWVPSPETLGLNDGFSIRQSTPKTLAGIEYLPQDFRENVTRGATRSFLDLESPPPERISAGAIEVVRTDLDEDDLADRVTEAAFERATGYAGYTLYEDPEQSSRAVAVGGGVVVFGRDWGDLTATEVVTTTIDTVAGDAERYVDAYEPLAIVDDRIDVGLVTIYRPDRERLFEGAQASGVQFEFGSDRTSLTIPIVFANVDDARSAELERTYGDTLDDFSKRRDGRVVVVTGTTETDELA